MRDSLPFVVVLGIAQDGGFPQAGCRESCCQAAWQDGERRRHVTCLAIVDPLRRQQWIIDCTPDFPAQLQTLNQLTPPGELSGILLTHAHLGHYTGLVYLGKEAMNASVPLFVMNRMRQFLEDNQPWKQLAANGHVQLVTIAADGDYRLNDRVTVTPLLVPHRGEFSETVGFIVRGPSQAALYIPDIDQWEQMPTVRQLVESVDVAYLDGTFFSADELAWRDMSEVPHPTLQDSLAYFSSLPSTERDKIRFLHFNHTNPVLDASCEPAGRVRSAGYHLAEEGETFSL